MRVQRKRRVDHPVRPMLPPHLGAPSLRPLLPHGWDWPTVRSRAKIDDWHSVGQPPSIAPHTPSFLHLAGAVNALVRGAGAANGDELPGNGFAGPMQTHACII